MRSGTSVILLYGAMHLAAWRWVCRGFGKSTVSEIGGFRVTLRWGIRGQPLGLFLYIASLKLSSS